MGGGGNGKNHFYFLLGGDGKTRGERAAALRTRSGRVPLQASFLAAWAFVWEMNKTKRGSQKCPRTHPNPTPLPPTLEVPMSERQWTETTTLHRCSECRNRAFAACISRPNRGRPGPTNAGTAVEDPNVMHKCSSRRVVYLYLTGMSNAGRGGFMMQPHPSDEGGGTRGHTRRPQPI